MSVSWSSRLALDPRPNPTGESRAAERFEQCGIGVGVGRRAPAPHPAPGRPRWPTRRSIAASTASRPSSARSPVHRVGRRGVRWRGPCDRDPGLREPRHSLERGQSRAREGADREAGTPLAAVHTGSGMTRSAGPRTTRGSRSGSSARSSECRLPAAQRSLSTPVSCTQRPPYRGEAGDHLVDVLPNASERSTRTASASAYSYDSSASTLPLSPHARDCPQVAVDIFGATGRPNTRGWSVPVGERCLAVLVVPRTRRLFPRNEPDLAVGHVSSPRTPAAPVLRGVARVACRPVPAPSATTSAIVFRDIVGVRQSTYSSSSSSCRDARRLISSFSQSRVSWI